MSYTNDDLKRAWSKEQVRFFAKQLRDQLGEGWAWMVPEVREAMAAQKVLLVVLGQDRDSVEVESIQALLADVRRELGLLS